jgi:hypothetical protein
MPNNSILKGEQKTPLWEKKNKKNVRQQHLKGIKLGTDLSGKKSI